MAIRTSLLLVLLSATALPAQGKSLAVVPVRNAMIHAVAEDVQALLAALPKSAIGRLLAEPEVAAAWDAGLARFRAMAHRRDALVQAALAMQLASPEALASRVWQQLDVRDLQRAEMLALAPTEAQHMPAAFAIVGCTPKAEGRMTRLFEDHARLLAGNPRLSSVPDVKLDGYPVYRFTPVANEQEERMPFVRPEGVWLMHLPGLFAFGEGKPEDCAKVVEAPKSVPRVALTLDLKAYMSLFLGFGGGVPTEFSALGFNHLERLQWRASFAGEAVLDECELQLSEKPEGLVGALLGGKAALPPQALPEGALAQLRCAVDHVLLLQSIADLAGGGLPVPEAMQKELAAAFDGGLAFGVGAPATGGVIPRMYLTMRIADAAALDRLLPMLLPAELPRKEVTYEGTTCTVLTPPGMPQAVQPTFCRREGLLHVAESPLSMRAFLKAQKEGVVAMDTGDAPLPQGPGEVQPGFDLRCDETAMYRAFHQVWLPLYTLTAAAGGSDSHPLLRREDMPEPKVVEKHLGKSRGVLRKVEQRFVIQHQGALGGPELAALAMTWGPILSGFFHHDWSIDELERQVARKKLEDVWPLLEEYKKDKGSWPAKLGDLFQSRKLAQDALLIPGDEAAEPVELAAGDDRKIRSSFRYFSAPVKAGEGEGRMLLIAITGRQYRRAMLGDDGSLPDVWGEDSLKPIDKFGK